MSWEAFIEDRQWTYASFDTVNMELTRVFTKLNRIQIDCPVTWRPTPRQKKLPAPADLKKEILRRIADIAFFHKEVVAGVPGITQSTCQKAIEDAEANEDENESEAQFWEKQKDAEYYEAKVATKFGDGLSRTTVDVGKFQASIDVHEQTMVAMCLVGNEIEELLHWVTGTLMELESRYSMSADAS